MSTRTVLLLSFTMSDTSGLSGVGPNNLSSFMLADETVATNMSVSFRASERKRKKPKSDISSPRLISLVHAHRCIWDEEDELHVDLNAVSHAWELVADNFFDASAADCKDQWKGIMKSLNQNLTRHTKQLKGTGLPSKKQKPYKYLKALSFLKKVRDMEDEIVQGPSCLKKIHTSSPLRNNKEYGSSVCKGSTAWKYCDLNALTTPSSSFNGISPLKSSVSPLGPHNFQTASSLIHQESTLVDSNKGYTPTIPVKRIKWTDKNVPKMGRLPSIKEESGENSAKSLTSPSFNDRQRPVPKLTGNKNNELKISKVKLQAQKRENQCARIAVRVEKDMAVKNNQIVKCIPPKIEKRKINEDEIVDKLLEEEDRFMYSVLSVVQPLRALPLQRSRKVLLNIMKLVFDAEEEVEQERAKASTQAALVPEKEVKDGWRLSKPISQEDQDLIDSFLKQSVKSILPDTKFNMTVLVLDLQSLQPRELLNDVVINYYLAMLTSEARRSIYALSTFFFLDLINKDKGYKFAKNHTKKIDVFSFDLILVPIHKDKNHWVLAVIDMVEKTIRYYDSMGGQYIHCPSVLLQFLEEEHETRKNNKLESFLWSSQHMKVPQQDNGYDCGVFVCKYAECESQGIKCTFTQENMPTFRREMLFSIIRGKIF